MIERESWPDDPQVDSDGTIVSAVDWLGNRFHVEDLVMYCVGAGRGQMMAVGIVRRIERDAGQPWCRRPGLRVQVLTLFTSGHWDSQRRVSPAWVNPINITALTNLDAAIHARSIMETTP